MTTLTFRTLLLARSLPLHDSRAPRAASRFNGKARARSACSPTGVSACATYAKGRTARSGRSRPGA